MKLIIAGGRDYEFTAWDFSRLEQLHLNFAITEVVSGGAEGADKCGELWAHSCSIPVKRFNADWQSFGKSAGPMRNRRMAEYADAVVLFPGGKGTESMTQEARRAGIEIFDFRE